MTNHLIEAFADELEKTAAFSLEELLLKAAEEVTPKEDSEKDIQQQEYGRAKARRTERRGWMPDVKRYQKRRLDERYSVSANLFPRQLRKRLDAREKQQKLDSELTGATKKQTMYEPRAPAAFQAPKGELARQRASGAKLKGFSPREASKAETKQQAKGMRQVFPKQSAPIETPMLKEAFAMDAVKFFSSRLARTVHGRAMLGRIRRGKGLTRSEYSTLAEMTGLRRREMQRLVGRVAKDASKDGRAKRTFKGSRAMTSTYFPPGLAHYGRRRNVKKMQKRLEEKGMKGLNAPEKKVMRELYEGDAKGYAKGKGVLTRIADKVM